MFSTLLTAALVLAVQGDTSFAVSRGDRLALNNQNGSITVEVWNRDEVMLRITDDHRAVLDVKRRGSDIEVRPTGRHAHSSKDIVIRMPAWLPFTFGGVNTDVRIEGVAASVRGQTVNGDIWVRGGTELITLKAVNGDVTLENATGSVTLSSVDGDVIATGITGILRASSVDGDVTLQRITSNSVDANTVDGEIQYRGNVAANGRYRLVTHDGDVTLSATGPIDAAITVATFSGDFESDVPFTISELVSGGQRISFTLGNGSAEIHLEAFDGTIYLRQDGR